MELDFRLSGKVFPIVQVDSKREKTTPVQRVSHSAAVPLVTATLLL